MEKEFNSETEMRSVASTMEVGNYILIDDERALVVHLHKTGRDVDFTFEKEDGSTGHELYSEDDEVIYLVPTIQDDEDNRMSSWL